MSAGAGDGAGNLIFIKSLPQTTLQRLGGDQGRGRRCAEVVGVSVSVSGCVSGCVSAEVVGVRGRVSGCVRFVSAEVVGVSGRVSGCVSGCVSDCMSVCVSVDPSANSEGKCVSERWCHALRL